MGWKLEGCALGHKLLTPTKDQSIFLILLIIDYKKAI
jgi:hypothetical protein